MTGTERRGRKFVMRLSVLGGAAVALATALPAQAQIGSDRYSSIVVDAATGNVLEAANPDAPRHPASLAKLMTLYMAFEALRDRRVTTQDLVPVSPRAAAMEPSKLGLVPSSRLTVEDATKPPEKPETRPEPEKPAEGAPVASKPTADIPSPPPASVPKPKPDTISETTPPVPPPQPSRKAVGRYVAETIPTILVRRNKGTEPWERLVRETPVYTTDRLVSLPGYRSEVRLDDGVHLLLWGDVPDGSTRVLMLESAVVLNNSPDVDLDLLLDTGRILIANHKREGQARVRVRFHDQVWDLTLENRGEVAMELLSLPDFGFSTDPAKTSGPIAGLGLFMLQGQGTLKIRYDTYLLRESPGPAQVIWNNLGGMRGPQTIRTEQLPPWVRRLPTRGKEAQAMSVAEDGLANRMSGRGSVDLVLQETLKEQDAASRILAVYCFGATDDLPHLLNVLADEKYADVRIAAIGCCGTGSAAAPRTISSSTWPCNRNTNRAWPRSSWNSCIRSRRSKNMSPKPTRH